MQVLTKKANTKAKNELKAGTPKVSKALRLLFALMALLSSDDLRH